MLQVSWSALSDDATKLHVLISDGFYYRYPWGIASFVTILCAKLGRSRDTVGEGITNLSTYIKFGVNNPTACLAKGLGIKNRDVALLLSIGSAYLQGRNFIAWLANVTLEDVRDMNISRYDELNVLSVAVRLTPQRYSVTRTEYSFLIKGVPYEASRKATSLLAHVGDSLVYQRDFGNAFDPYAIKINIENRGELGFVPREYAKQISVDIDIDQAEYGIEVTNIEPQADYNRITVRMVKR